MTKAFLGSVRIRTRLSALEFVQGGDDRQSAEKLGNQAELDQVFGLNLAQDLAEAAFVVLFDLGAEPHELAAHAPVDDLLQPVEGAAADKKDIGGVHLHEVLLGMLATALGRHAGRGALDDFEQGLLNAFTGHVPGDGGVVRLAGDLVDFVDVDDAAFGLFHIVVGILQQRQG